jgi:phosphatidate cytidylyltransferase
MVITRRQAAASDSPTSAATDLTDATGATDAPSRSGDVQRAGEESSVKGQKGAQAKSSKMGDLVVRGVVAACMASTCVLVILGGHMWVAIAVVAMEVGMFREILGLGYPVAAGGKIPLWRTTGWYFFVSCLFLFYGKAVLAHFEDQGMSFMKHPGMQYALRHHSFISFVLYCAGCVGFVMSLKQGQYLYQFSYFGRALAALIIVVVQSHFVILNVRQGLVWFILPAALVICNDTAAYFCGRMFGRHSLTSLSPKKTWEGYIGAGFFTIVGAYFLAGYLARFQSLVCPKFEFVDCYLSCPPVTCDPVPYVFLPQLASVDLLPGVLPAFSFIYVPFQLHAVALGVFASAVAPFGGFMASGGKRAFGIKDYSNMFPGHGGVTDRVDCQLLMSVFTFVYLINFVKVNFSQSADVGKVMAFAYELTTVEQIKLLAELQNHLMLKGALAYEAVTTSVIDSSLP